jgi:hypothetical protein
MTRADWRILLLIGIPATIVFLLGLGVVVGLLLSGDPRPQPQQPVAVITVTVSAIPEAPPSAPADRSAPTPTASQQTTAAPPDTPSSVPVEPTPSAKPSGSRFKDPAWEIDP